MVALSKAVFPPMVKIKQTFPDSSLTNLSEKIKITLCSSELKNSIKPGMRVGITAGSRGINNIGKILHEVVCYLKELGAEPVLLGSMGSHGGGKSSGQRNLLESLGITEESVKAPIICSTECVEIGYVFYGKVFLSKIALECDAIVVVNRIKPHTSFYGDYESGLLKMLVVGLGGPAGAASLHRCPPHLLSRAVAEAGREILRIAPVVMGLAIIEDAYDQTCKLVWVNSDSFLKIEKKLLKEARAYLPGLPTNKLDLLIVDEIGKNISGTGMDTNVIGRMRICGTPEPTKPMINKIAVLDLTPESHGNAYGIGLADFTTTRLVDKLDRHTMYLNALTTSFTQRAMLPMIFSNDKEAVFSALKSIKTTAPQKCRIIRIRNTLKLFEMLVSEAVFNEICEMSSISAIKTSVHLEFDSKGNLSPF
jgi:hypothetical protein